MAKKVIGIVFNARNDAAKEYLVQGIMTAFPGIAYYALPIGDDPTAEHSFHLRVADVVDGKVRTRLNRLHDAYRVDCMWVITADDLQGGYRIKESDHLRDGRLKGITELRIGICQSDTRILSDDMRKSFGF